MYIGQLDITCEVSMMVSYVGIIREYQMHQVMYILSFLNGLHDTIIFMGPKYLDIEEEYIQVEYWNNLYGVLYAD